MEFTDEIGRQIRLSSYPPQRIVSLVPSLTELLYDLGLAAQVVGRTRFCIHPQDQVGNAEVVGGTKNPKLKKIRELEPQLIIASKEENRPEDVEALESEIPIFVTDVKDFQGSLAAIGHVGEVVACKDEAERLIAQIQDVFLTGHGQKHYPRVAYLIWKDPYMVAGGDTYISSILEEAGFRNAFEEHTRYPEVSLQNLEASKPDYLFLSSEPYPFRETHLEALREALPNSKPTLVDGEFFSWYGTRLLKKSDYLVQLTDRLLNQ